MTNPHDKNPHGTLLSGEEETALHEAIEELRVSHQETCAFCPHTANLVEFQGTYICLSCSRKLFEETQRAIINNRLVQPSKTSE